MLVTTSELVQPELCSLVQLVSWAVIAADVHGILPLYRPCHWLTGKAPIIM